MKNKSIEYLESQGHGFYYEYMIKRNKLWKNIHKVINKIKYTGKDDIPEIILHYITDETTEIFINENQEESIHVFISNNEKEVLFSDAIYIEKINTRGVFTVKDIYNLSGNELIFKNKLNIKVDEANNFMESIYTGLNFDYNEENYLPRISIKSFKKGGTIYFASALRMFEDEREFVLILICYEQLKEHKKTIFSRAFHITKEILKELKGTIKYNELYEFQEIIKKIDDSKKASAIAKKIKEDKFKGNSIFGIEYKIDSKKQRRIQTTLTSKRLHNLVSKEVSKIDYFEIGTIKSKGRSILNKFGGRELKEEFNDVNYPKKRKHKLDNYKEKIFDLASEYLPFTIIGNKFNVSGSVISRYMYNRPEMFFK